MLVERVLGYDGDGRALEVLFLDGVEVRQTTCYELDPDDRMLRYTGSGPWLERQHAIAAAASPAAGDLIRYWAEQIAERGAVEEPDGFIDGEVVAGDLALALNHDRLLPPGGQQ